MIKTALQINTQSPSMSPTVTAFTATQSPTVKPASPTVAPTTRPTTKSPTKLPSTKPSNPPSLKPSKVPTKSPSKAPTYMPSYIPSPIRPSKVPTKSPSKAPTCIPSYIPSSILPINFDARTNPSWSSCSARIAHIRDQSDCGSCWAFAVVEAFNDRYCIAKASTLPLATATIPLSAEDVNDCCTGPACGYSNGCNGGSPTGVWNWLVSNGVVTGGDFNSSDIGKGKTCKPYSLPPCAHHVDPLPPGLSLCPTMSPTGVFPTPVCTSVCSDTKYRTASYASDKKFAKTAYRVSGVMSIQNEIYTNGPVVATFTVYADFLTYGGGVYQLTSTTPPEGGHAVKLIGM